jgi:hypothetical protein
MTLGPSTLRAFEPPQAFPHTISDVCPSFYRGALKGTPAG